MHKIKEDVAMSYVVNEIADGEIFSTEVATAISLKALQSPWLVDNDGVSETTRTMRLFCFHYAGSSAAMFREWASKFPKAVQVIAVQLPGRDYRLHEEPISDMGKIVIEVGAAIEPLLDMPFAFFGHSMGALVGYEVARLLRRKGMHEPRVLFVSGRNAPEFGWKDPNIRLLSDDEMVDAVRDYNGTPDYILNDRNLRSLWLPRFRADLTASVLYEYTDEKPLKSSIVVMYGDADILVSMDGLLAWSRHTNEKITSLVYKGNHFYVHFVENQIIADIIDFLKTQKLINTI